MNFAPYKPRAYASTKDVVTRTLDQAGGVKRAAHLLGRSPTQTVAYSDPATTDEMTFDQVRRLVTATGATAPVEDLAALAGGVFLPGSVPDDCFEALAAQSAERWGAFTAEVFRALRDQDIGDAELPIIRKHLDELIRAVVCARTKLIARDGPEEAGS